MREFPRPESILLERDRFTVWVPATTWSCPFCYGTVAWQGRDTVGPSGRCGQCGVKLCLARVGEHVPDHWEQIGEKRRACPDCGKRTLVRFEWAHTALPPRLWYWRCAMPGGCWAGPFVQPAYRRGEADVVRKPGFST